MRAIGVGIIGDGLPEETLVVAPDPAELEERQKEKTAELLALLDRALCRVDLQLETPAGAIALREWAGPAPQVLLKTAHGPRLVSDPWQEVAA